MPVTRIAPGSVGTLSRLQSFVTLVRNFVYDFRRYRASSFIDGPRERQNLEAHIRLLSHMLEYGLSLSDPRGGFGIDKVRLLTEDWGNARHNHADRLWSHGREFFGTGFPAQANRASPAV